MRATLLALLAVSARAGERWLPEAMKDPAGQARQRQVLSQADQLQLDWNGLFNDCQNTLKKFPKEYLKVHDQSHFEGDGGVFKRIERHIAAAKAFVRDAHGFGKPLSESDRLAALNEVEDGRSYLEFVRRRIKPRAEELRKDIERLEREKSAKAHTAQDLQEAEALIAAAKSRVFFFPTHAEKMSQLEAFKIKADLDKARELLDR